MKTRALAAFAATALSASFASAGTSYGFEGVSNNKAADTLIAESQLSFDVSESGGDAVFKFSNSGPDAASIVQIYWDDNAGVLDALTSWSTTTPTTGSAPFGVNFAGGSASPPNLPSGGSFSADYSIEAKSQGGKSKNGVGAGENVSIVFSLDKSFTDLLSALNSGALKVGVHVQAFDGGGSESLVSTSDVPGTGIPTPTAALAGLGLMGLIASRRRRED